MNQHKITTEQIKEGGGPQGNMSSDNLVVAGVRLLIGIDPGVNTGVAVWDRAAGMLVTVDGRLLAGYGAGTVLRYER